MILRVCRLAVRAAKSVGPWLVIRYLHYTIGNPALSIVGFCSVECAVEDGLLTDWTALICRYSEVTVKRERDRT